MTVAVLAAATSVPLHAAVDEPVRVLPHDVDEGPCRGGGDYRNGQPSANGGDEFP